jgi:hypothetical protein
MSAGQGGVDHRPHARTCGMEERRDGLREARPRVTAWPSESAVGHASSRAKGHRWRTTAGEGGVRPVVLNRWSVPTGEPSHTETVPHGSEGAGRKGGDSRSRLRPTRSRASLPLPAAGARQRWGAKRRLALRAGCKALRSQVAPSPPTACGTGAGGANRTTAGQRIPGTTETAGETARSPA